MTVQKSPITKEVEVSKDLSAVVHDGKRRASCQWLAAYTVSPKTTLQRVISGIFWVIVVVAFIAILVWALPKLILEGIIPLTKKMKKELSPVEIGLVLAAAVFLVPFTFLPFYPFVWLCAPIMSFWPCFVIVEVCSTVGMLVMFYMGKTILHKRAEKWAERKETLRAVFAAMDRVGHFKVLVLLRIAPVPYALINYCSGAVPKMSALSYIIASFIGLLPRHALWVYFGRHLKGIAALLRGQQMPKTQLIYNLVALVVSLVVLIGGATFGALSLRKIRREQEEREAQPLATDVEAGSSSDDSAAVASAAAGSDSSADCSPQAEPAGAAAAITTVSAA